MAVDKWWLGAVLAVLNVIFSAGGVTLQKMSYKMEGLEDKGIFRPANVYWFSGVTLYILAAPLDVLSILTTTLTVVASVLPLNIVLVALFSWIWLDAEITAQYGVGILLCSVGCAVSMIFAPKEDSVQLNSPADFFVPQVIGYILIVVCVCVGFLMNSYLQWRGASAAAFALVIAWVYSLERMFSSGMRTVVNGPFTCFSDLNWVWMPLSVLCFGIIGLITNVVAVRYHPTHTLVPLVIGLNVIVMAFQSVWMGEVKTFDDTSRSWGAGVLLSTMGVLLVKKTDVAEKGPELELLLPKKTSLSEETLP